MVFTERQEEWLLKEEGRGRPLKNQVGVWRIALKEVMYAPCHRLCSPRCSERVIGDQSV